MCHGSVNSQVSFCNEILVFCVNFADDGSLLFLL